MGQRPVCRAAHRVSSARLAPLAHGHGPVCAPERDTAGRVVVIAAREAPQDAALRTPLPHHSGLIDRKGQRAGAGAVVGHDVHDRDPTVLDAPLRALAPPPTTPGPPPPHPLSTRPP